MKVTLKAAKCPRAIPAFVFVKGEFPLSFESVISSNFPQHSTVLLKVVKADSYCLQSKILYAHQ